VGLSPHQGFNRCHDQAAGVGRGRVRSVVYVDSVPWRFCLVLVAGVVAAYLFDQVPLVAIAMAVVALLGLSVTARTGPWWAKEAVAWVLAGVAVETLRAVLSSSAFDPSPRAGGGKVAWFTDPDGNTFAVESD
jgi:hypothetical protein